ncbi:hypothetical protein V2E24_01505 [Mycoplasmopsis ciconiae]|uniref:Trigger factor n=1 Tax=Mycoplasmopsis ciconiae TaxID=561067 RepID=A0ABU7MLB9_9BACT|nr:hypothetical protein [Mycoplasmopsis ciconiae]
MNQDNKFYDLKVVSNTDEWMKFQKQALDDLKANATDKKWDQKDILNHAADLFVRSKVAENFKKFSSDFSRCYFSPLVTDVKVNLEECSALLKFHYIDDLDRFNVDVKLDIPFRDDLEDDPNVKPFIESFMSEYNFKIDSTDPIIDGDIVTLNVFDENKKVEKTLNIEMNPQSDLYEVVKGMKAGDFKIVDQKHYTIQKVKTTKLMPINDETVKYINIDSIKNVEDAKKYIIKVVTEQLFFRELAEYKNLIIKYFVKNMELPSVPEELMLGEYEALKEQIRQYFKNIGAPVEEEAVQKIYLEELPKIKAQREQSFKELFLNIFIPRKLKIEVTNPEIEAEYRMLLSFIPLNERNQANISLGKIVEVLTNRKVALYYLKKSKPEIFNKYFKD